MSSSTGRPAQYDTSPVSSTVRRGAPVHRRAQSESAVNFGPGMGFAFGSTSSRNARAAGAGPPSFVGSYGPRPSTTTGAPSARYADELYENYFIGSTKRPRNQNEILDPEDISKIEKEEGAIERKNELSDAIKSALGTKKKAYKYKDNLPTRQYSGLLASRANSLEPKYTWSTVDVNAYRMRKN